MINTRMNNLIETSADPVVILGIDHGFGNIKTAHACFRAGVTACDHEPTFRSNLLVHQGRCYIIGEEHKEFTPDKMRDDDYYQEALGHMGDTPKRWETSEINDIMNLSVRGWRLAGQHRFLRYGQQRSWTRALPEKPKPEEFTDVTGDPDVPIFSAQQLTIDGC